MGLVRNLYRKLLDHEVGVLGDELERMSERLRDLQLQVATFGARYERMANRVGMRMARAARRGEAPGSADEFAQLVEAEARRRGGADRDEDDDDRYPDFRRIQ